MEAGSETALRAKGKLRMEGKDYITQDGDIVHIHFKV
jgi:ribosome-binding ATPase YchF (GTP1/OBG family)